MRQKQSLPMILALFFLVLIGGQIPVMAQDKVVLSSADPADNSTVEKLKVITTKWAYPSESVGPYINTKAKALLKNEAGETLQEGKIRGYQGSIRLQFDTEVTEVGNYTVTIPADITMGATGYNDDGTMKVIEGSGNVQTELHYKIAAPVQPAVLSSADPADNSTVEKLKVITTKWTYPSESVGPYINTKAKALLKDAAGETLQEGKLRGYQGAIRIQFDTEVTEAGSYTVTIPADATMGATGYNDDGTMKVIEGSGNAETVLHYTIAAAVQPAVLSSADPADNSTVEKLKVITTKWTYPSESVGPYINTKAKALLKNEAGETLQEGKLRGYQGAIRIQFDTEVTEAGTYTVTIPADVTMGATGYNDDGTMKVIEGSGNAETVLHYTIAAAVQPTVLSSADPADNSTVEKLKVITTVWTYPAESVGPYINTSAKALLKNAEGETLQEGKIRGYQGSIRIQFDTEVTEAGAYTVTIPADVTMGATGYNDDGTMKVIEGSGNAETVLHYTIAAAVQPTVLSSADPADNSTVEKLKVITTVWTYPAESVGPYINTSAKALLKNAEGETLQEGKIRGYQGSIRIQFDTEVTEAGAYTVTIPADVTMGATGYNDDGTMKVIEGSGNAETVLHYTIAAAVQPTVLSSADPADNSTVEKLKVITTVWTYPAESVGPYINTSAKALLKNAEGETLQEGKIRGYQGSIRIQFDTEVIEAGTYTVIIPADVTMGATGYNDDGTLKVIAGSENEETVLHYTVKPNVGVTGVNADDADVEYYNLNGLRVSRPDKGIYIKKTGSKVEKVKF